MFVFKKLSVQEVIAKTKKRDQVFLKDLFESLNPMMLKVLYANKIFTPHSDELLHQTWVRYFENFEKFQGQSQLSTFLIGILINKIKEFRRSQKKMVFEDDSEAVYRQAFTTDGWWIQKPDSPDHLIESKDLSQQIQECLEGLTEQQKTAFILKEVHEDESEEICNTLGVSLSNLRVLIFRAKDKLKKCLDGKSGQSGMSGYR